MRRAVTGTTSAARRALALIIVLTSAGALTSCLPGATPALAPPTFRLQTDATRILRLDPPGVAREAALVVRLALRATNPNPVGVRLERLDGELWLGGVAAAELTFVGGIDLPARGDAPLTLEVAVPLDRLEALAGVLTDAIGGRPVAYRVDAAVGIDVLGVPTRFPPVTLARGEVRQADLVPAAPRVRFDPAATGVREVRFDRITVAIGLIVDNPGPLGFVLRAPDARLRLGGQDVLSIGVPATWVPAGGSAVVRQEVVLNPVAVGVAIATQLQTLGTGGAAALDAAIVGRWELDLGVLGRWTSDAGVLVAGRID